MQVAGEGYYLYEQSLTYGEVEQRWLLVLYEPKRELKQLDRAVWNEHEQARKALKQLCRKDFSCEADARLALARLSDKWKYHQLESQVQPLSRHQQLGRPRAHPLPPTVCQSHAN